MIQVIKNRARQLVENIGDRINRQENYIATFDTPQGRKVLEDLCKRAHVINSAFVEGDTQQTAYENGKRDIVLGILRQINKDQSALIRQIEEASANEQNT